MNKLNVKNYGKIINYMYDLAIDSMNYTWFLEIDDFVDGTFNQGDLDELNKDIDLIKSIISNIDSIIESFSDWKDEYERGNDVIATFYGDFLDIFGKY